MMVVSFESLEQEEVSTGKALLTWAVAQLSFAISIGIIISDQLKK
jgi:hypothetical protein